MVVGVLLMVQVELMFVMHGIQLKVIVSLELMLEMVMLMDHLSIQDLDPDYLYKNE